MCRLVLADGRGIVQHVPTPVSFHAEPSETGDRSSVGLASDLEFFHWELEFPDVFTPERSGFDALIGNPPWDVMKPNSQEFFTEFDPLYRTYDKQAALAKQQELFECARAWPTMGRVQRPVQGARQLGQERRRSVRPGPGAGKDGTALAAALGKASTAASRIRRRRAPFPPPAAPT